MKISVIGTGYVGLVTGTCLAETGNEVICVDIDKEKVEILNKQAEQIVANLLDFRSRSQASLQLHCAGLSQSAADADNNCNFDSDSTYEPGEEMTFNFLPKSASDSSSARYYSATTFTSGNLTSMRNLMSTIGLPTEYAQDPFGRTLQYDSNSTSVLKPPYQAEVQYQ